MTWRRLGVLLDGLPGESLYKTAVRDALGDEKLAELAKKPRDGHGPWSHTDLLLASIVDRLGELTYVVMAIAGNKPKPPKPVPRPGVISGKSLRTTLRQQAYLAYLRAHRGAEPPPEWHAQLDRELEGG